ncbi:MAG: AAA family ATPase [Acidobacteria bacterium]|nr:MAG: AAA family ATPase [Acidobacteriota bacterium]
MQKNLLLTGHPGVGKTTLIVKMIGRSGQYPITGFYTEEIREQGERVGFRAVTLNGSSAVFAHKDYHTDPRLRVGRYGIKPEVLETLVLPHLQPARKNARIVFIDEIAKMEILSEKIKEHIWAVLESDIPVVATITMKGTGFVKHVKSRPDVKLITVTERNRDILTAQLGREIGSLLAHELP